MNKTTTTTTPPQAGAGQPAQAGQGHTPTLPKSVIINGLIYEDSFIEKAVKHHDDLLSHIRAALGWLEYGVQTKNRCRATALLKEALLHTQGNAEGLAEGEG